MSEVKEPPLKRFLNVPSVGDAHYKKNFIRQAVCEFRFPTLFELEAARPPLEFAKALRKEFPNYAASAAVNINADGVDRSRGHIFRSRDNVWVVNLRAASISLETTAYDSFASFEKRLEILLVAAKQVVDTDFFTRIGLRYINALPITIDEIDKWVNPSLVGALASGVFGDVGEHSSRVVGSTKCGGFLFGHGISTTSKPDNPEYMLDFDFFREDVAISESMDVVNQLHREEFNMFAWSLGPKGKEHLGPSDFGK
jgi:uncharacterized protein (TIGR04255 family)